VAHVPHKLTLIILGPLKPSFICPVINKGEKKDPVIFGALHGHGCGWFRRPWLESREGEINFTAATVDKRYFLGVNRVQRRQLKAIPSHETRIS
jgi:hypothetical protein